MKGASRREVVLVVVSKRMLRKKMVKKNAESIASKDITSTQSSTSEEFDKELAAL